MTELRVVNGYAEMNLSIFSHVTESSKFSMFQMLGLTERYPTHGNRNPLKSQTCVDYITL